MLDEFCLDFHLIWKNNTATSVSEFWNDISPKNRSSPNISFTELPTRKIHTLSQFSKRGLWKVAKIMQSFSGWNEFSVLNVSWINLFRHRTTEDCNFLFCVLTWKVSQRNLPRKISKPCRVLIYDIVAFVGTSSFQFNAYEVITVVP